MPNRRTMTLACVTTLMLAGLTGGRAQGQAAVPEQMPFDIPYGTPINLETAQKAITAAEAEARGHHWKDAIAVVDPAGQLVAFVTMDGTQYGSIAIAQAKARTAAVFRRPSKVFEGAVNTGGAPATLSLLAIERAAGSEGGLPIVIGGRLVGAIGASGGLSSQDGVTAQAGLDAVTGR